MPLEIVENDTQATGAPAMLVDAIRPIRDTIQEIRIERRVGKRYESTRMVVRVATMEQLGDDAPKDGHDETPEEIARAIFDLAAKYSSAHGSTHFRAIFYGENDKGFLAKMGTPAVFAVGIDADGMAHATTGADAEGNTLELLKRIGEDSHSRHMAALDKTAVLSGHVVELATNFATVAGPMAQASVDIKRIEFDRHDRDLEHEEKKMWVSGAFDFLQQLAEPFGVTLADVAQEYAREHMGGASPSTGRAHGYAKRLDDLISGLDPDTVSQVAGALGADGMQLIDAMRKASDDGEFRNLAAKLKELTSGGAITQQDFIRFAKLIGMKRAQKFSQIMKEATQ